MFVRPASSSLHTLARLAFVIGAACSQLPAHSAPANPMMPVIRAAVQGDMQSALKELRAIDPAGLSEHARSIRQCMIDRFTTDKPIPGGDALPAPAPVILEAFRRYWTGLMLRRTSTDDAEAQLLKTLKTIPGLESGADLHATTDAVKTRLEALGVHAQTDVTAPYYELMIWRREDTQQYSVPLPEQTVQVTVVFMDDFVVRGWLGYATCDVAGAGGWATTDRLYAVAGAYDRNSENFRFSYLGHEGQHFADYASYPKLEQPELEYRAKLVELAQSDTITRTLLLAFEGTAARGRSVPHAHAQYWLVKRMRERLIPDAKAGDADAWQAVDDAAIRKTARELLLESSAELRRMGAKTVTRSLDD